MTYDLKALREAADEALDLAFSEDINGAINWGDLSCVSAEHYVTDDGDEGYRVHIEEADPSNFALWEYVTKHLAAKGFTGVEVEFEW